MAINVKGRHTIRSNTPSGPRCRGGGRAPAARRGSSRRWTTGSSGSSVASMRRRRPPNDSAVRLRANSLPVVK
jgi:hypothetical protein